MIFLELHHGILDLSRRYRVESGAGFVEENDLRLKGERSGDTEALLLPPRQFQGRASQPVLDLVPKIGRLQAILDEPVQSVFINGSGEPRAVGDIVVNRPGQRNREGEDHSHPFPQAFRFEVFVDVPAVQEDRAAHPHVRLKIVQPVQASQERRFAGVGRPDHAQDLVFLDVKGEIV